MTVHYKEFLNTNNKTFKKHLKNTSKICIGLKVQYNILRTFLV